MARTGASSPGRSALPWVIVVLGVCALLPLNWLGWVGWFAGLSETVLTPVSHPLRAAGRVFVPAPRREDELDAERLRRLFEGEQLKRQQAELEIERLTQIIDRISAGAAVNPSLEVRQLPAPVTGAVGQYLVVRAGARSGVVTNSIVTADGFQLLGQVEGVDERTCRVLPITAPGAGSISGVILTDATGEQRLPCILAPAGDNTLRGEFELAQDPVTGAAINAVVPGQEVRLLDDTWPGAAQLLLVGLVERVEPDEALGGLNRLVVVRPRATLRQVGEVVVRVPLFDDPDRETGDGEGTP